MSATPTPPSNADLAQLRDQVRTAMEQHAADPVLRQGLGAALASLERRLGIERPPQMRRDRRRVDGLR